MKQWTKNFLDKFTPNKVVHCDENAINAEKSTLKIPAELWNEISDELVRCNCIFSIKHNSKSTRTQKFNTAFMAGFACGWVEKSKDVE
jgi:hypothetical protein